MECNRTGKRISARGEAWNRVRELPPKSESSEHVVEYGELCHVAEKSWRTGHPATSSRHRLFPTYPSSCMLVSVYKLAGSFCCQLPVTTQATRYL
ncbi:hypothetical protein Y1Q_0001046 [Alligator mississippiensis]|uniref:Uncharacterized protein n=1 Tax=Alligator mississippiensis TaxID=8496 RepID=A0A151NEJ7_ALLMI|nr:hypothetical protein Y1Q_0001046 [Alligator mississippiensis]